MRALFDVNAILALLDPGHTFHGAIRRWWADHRDGGWASCPLTQNGFLRVVTQPSYPNPSSMRDALEALSLGARQPDHAFWPDDVALIDDALVDRTRILGPRQLTDIYLLALAVKHGGRLVTFDRGVPIAAVTGAKPANLVAI